MGAGRPGEGNWAAKDPPHGQRHQTGHDQEPGKCFSPSACNLCILCSGHALYNLAVLYMQSVSTLSLAFGSDCCCAALKQTAVHPKCHASTVPHPPL